MKITYLAENLIQLQHGHHLACALPPPIPKHHLYHALHLPPAFRIAPLLLQPPLRSPDITVDTKHLLVPLHRTEGSRNLSSTGDEPSIAGIIALGRDDLEGESIKGRAHAQGLVDYCLEIGEGEGFGVDDAWRRDETGRDAFVDFALQTRVGARVGAEVEQAGADAGGGGVRAGENLEDGFGLALALGEAAADERALMMF